MEMDQYLEVFIDESKEHLQSLNKHILELEKKPSDLKIVNEIFRSAHTLKGMSATMGYDDLAHLTHQMENVLDGIRNEKIFVTTEILDVVFQAVDSLEAMVNSIATGGNGKHDVSKVVASLQKIENGDERSIDQIAVAKEAVITPPISENQYDQFETTVINQAQEQGFVCYEITIKLRENCVLKAARVYMVFDVLDKIGEVIKSSPSAELLEEEQFDQQFTVTYITKEPKEDLTKRIMKVSEIETVEIIPLNLENTRMTGKESIPSSQLDDQGPNEVVRNEDDHAEEPAHGTQQMTKVNKTIRVNIERLDILMNLFEELVIDRGRLEQIARDLNNSELNETVERMSRISGDLQTIILNMRMVPVETVFNRFPRMVRQLARELGKKIKLEIIGAETELDRTVIDEIGDPLVHLLRNAIDHGIEMPEVRTKNRKNEEGNVVLKAYHSGNHVFIEITDDGAGISREKVLQKALKKGIVSNKTAKNMSDSQVFDLLFSSGFSTAEVISDISGRGVGLDVVKNTIESLGGSISIESTENKGSIFSIQLPLTLSIISVMLVEIQNEKFAIPLSSIIETAIVKQTEILNAHNQKMIDYRGKIVPLIFLKEIFEVPIINEENGFYSVIIVRKGEKMAALVVDSFIGQQEVVLKSLGNYLTNVFAISGATILGDGQVALIVDCNALIR